MTHLMILEMGPIQAQSRHSFAVHLLPLASGSPPLQSLANATSRERGRLSVGLFNAGGDTGALCNIQYTRQSGSFS